MAEEPNRIYHFLHLEDDPRDAEVIRDILRDAGITNQTVLVRSREEFLKAIEREKYDLILSDFSLPSFDGNEALAAVREKSAETPFIFVSGRIGEDAAIQSLLEGATDYILKTKLGRLVPAVRRALHEGEERKRLRHLEEMRQKAVDELQASEARFRGLLESAPDAVIITDSRGGITFANVETERVFGFKMEQLLGEPLSVLVPHRFRQMHDKLVTHFNVEPHRRSLNSGTELFGLKKDGTEFPADIMLSPLKMDHGVSVLAMIRDTTAAKKAELALRQNEENFRHIYEFSPVGILSFDANGNFLRCNPAVLNILGYTEAELTGTQFNTLTHPDDRDIGMELLEQLSAGTKEVISYEKRYLRKDGKVVWAYRIVSAVRDSENNLKYTVSIIEDITERKEAEDALRRSEDKYRSLVDGARDAIFSLSTGGIIQSLNPAFEVMTGWKRKQWVGRSFTDLLHPEDRKKVTSAFQRLVKGEVSEIEEYRVTKKSGESLTLEFNSTVQMRDRKVVGVLGVARDVTAQKFLEEELRQSQKLESIGTLAGGIAHDFNNILGIIVGYAGLIKKSLHEEMNLSRDVEAIEVAAKRGVGLVRQLLTFARKEERVSKSFDVNEVITDTFRLVQETFPKVISMNLRLSERPLITVGDPTEIHQAVLNLCVNARDSILDRQDGRPASGNLEITTAFVNGKGLLEKFPSVSYDEYVAITVSDTGAGMDEATRARIFEPFFTTKERGKGTGLGLATVYGIVEGHEGFIRVSSKLGHGTTFEVFLPSRENSEIPEIEDDTESVDVRGGGETVLVVEDESGLREFLTEVLTNRGYKVLAAGDGQKAIVLFLENRDIKLVLSDIGLPNVSGVELLEAVKKSNPDVKVILASGFVEDEEKDRATQHGINAFLQKPYRLDEVLRLVRSVLDAE
ncbi:MAG: PAS domain S-box protein [Bacteroidetes bacterium]|nr:PAS domain S-box protein [Bacteroidota bacterium]